MVVRQFFVKDEHVEVSKSVSKADFDAIVDFCREHKLFVLTYHDGFIIYEGDHEYMNIESELTGLPMKRVDDIKAYIQADVPKVMGVDYVPNITSLNIELAGHFNEEVDVTTSKPYFLEFMARDVSKGNALAAFCKSSILTCRKLLHLVIVQMIFQCLTSSGMQ